MSDDRTVHIGPLTCIPDNPCIHYRAAIAATIAGERHASEQKITAAINTIKTSRQTHVEWSDYLRRNQDYNPGAIGDADYHEEAVREYDNVLAVLTAGNRWIETPDGLAKCPRCEQKARTA